MRSAAKAVVAMAALLVMGTSACGGGGGDSAGAPTTAATVAPTVTTAPAAVTTTTSAPAEPAFSFVASANGESVAVYDAPDPAAEPAQSLDNPTENGGPLVFLVKDKDSTPGWLEVYLPVRPNGSTGWIQADGVDVAVDDYRVEVAIGAHRIRVFKGDDVVLDEPVGVGTNDTPTPGGVFYLKELLQPPDPTGPYGPYAYGLSGYSNVLSSFAGGDGVIGIHGTNDPSSIGRDVSHGCIRMSNEGITRLAGLLPLGTPVAILP
jgi:lipoprotein-anchoring transpeptidase ErfK/SrfK